MACMHPAVPRQQALEDIPHNHDDGNPQSCAHQDPSNHPLAVRRHVATVDDDKQRKVETVNATCQLPHDLDQVWWRKHTER